MPMKRIPLSILVAAMLCVWGACSSLERSHTDDAPVHLSEQLIIDRISAHGFIHTSYHHTDDVGNVPCNGLIVRYGNEMVVFDTPTKDDASEELISWIQNELHCSVKAVVPKHFHVDCLGGL